jgi:CRISPR/Cas system-associated exonuclease Cas4 (RecB family)
MPWSYSSLDTYETCPFRYKLKYIERMPEPPPDPKKPAAKDRGNMIHKQLELYVNGSRPDVPPECEDFHNQLITLRQLYAVGKVEVEQNWFFDSNWGVFPQWKDAWCQVKADVFVNDGDSAVVIDHKTGKKFGNEVKHTQQTNVYSLAAFFRYPDLHTVKTEIWYHDVNDILPVTYRRDQAMRFLPRLEKRVEAMLHDTMYRPRPNVVNCKYCPYGRNGTGHCPVSA